jgi:hypothetical protein
MNDTLRAMTTGAAITVLVIVGLLGLYCFFADLSQNETWIGRGLFLLGIYAIGCGLFGVLVPRHGYGALIAAWGPLLISLPGLISKIVNRGEYPYWSYLASIWVVVPGACLLFGYAGSRLRRKLSRPRNEEP